MKEALPIQSSVEDFKRPERGVFQKAKDWLKGIPFDAGDFSPINLEEIRKFREKDIQHEKSPEYQKLNRDLQKVVSRLFEKKKNPESKEIRPLLLVWGGGLKGPYGAGQELALHEMGLGEVFDVAVGNSAGSADIIYFLGGPEQTAIGASLYDEECTTEDFFKLSRLRQMMRVKFIADKMTSGKKAVDLDAINKLHTEFYVIATNVKNNQAELIDAKTVKEGPIEAVRASMSVPGADGSRVTLNRGEKNEGTYVDGSFGATVTLREIIKKFDPTDILFLTNAPNLEDLKISAGEEMLAGASAKLGTMSSFRPLVHIEKGVRSQETLGEMIKEIDDIQKETGVNIGVALPPEGGLTTTLQDRGKIARAIWNSARDMLKKFGWEQPAEINMYHSEEK